MVVRARGVVEDGIKKRIFSYRFIFLSEKTVATSPAVGHRAVSWRRELDTNCHVVRS